MVFSLFELCLDFAAVRVDAVESLVNFPEDVGKRIWLKVIEKWRKRVITDETLRAAAALFAEAYPDEVLPSAKCRLPAHKMCSSAPSLLKYAVHLDLTGAALGDEHDLLRSFHSFECLKTLILCKNGITDAGIRSLLGPFLMNRDKSFAAMDYLDLSLNDVGHKALEKMALLPKLEVFLASFSHKRVPYLSKKFAEAFRFEIGGKRRSVSDRGWAFPEPGIEALLVDQNLTREDEGEPSENASLFYPSSKRRKVDQNATPSFAKLQLFFFVRKIGGGLPT